MPEIVVLAFGFYKGWFSACRYRVLGFWVLVSQARDTRVQGLGFADLRIGPRKTSLQRSVSS